MPDATVANDRGQASEAFSFSNRFTLGPSLATIVKQRTDWKFLVAALANEVLLAGRES